MALYPNDARNERTGHQKGGSKGEQGAHGTGKVKCGSEGNSGSPAKFSPASEVIGAPIAGELDVPGFGLMKGASAPAYEGPKKGNPGKPAGGAGGLRKSKDAEDAGR